MRIFTNKLDTHACDGDGYDKRFLVAFEDKMKRVIKRRLSYQRYKKMRSHIEELKGFFLENLGALQNMIEAGMEEEMQRKRRDD